jgi:hypothetical protein
MPEAKADTHGDVVVGAGSTAAGETLVSGSPITLPAGGPWTIFYTYCQAVAATATAGESVGGYFRLNAKSGDVTPSPNPSKFPTALIPSVLGATIDVRAVNLKLIPVNYEAAGKAVLEIYYNETTAVTVASQIVAGIIFGKTRPVEQPYQFCDVGRAQVTAAAATALTSITISEKATKIVGLAGMLAQDGVLTTAEELLGFFTLSSNDIDFAPGNYPFNAAYSAGLGALINQGPAVMPSIIPVEIPVIGGAVVNIQVDLNTAVTNAAEVAVYVFYI